MDIIKQKFIEQILRDEGRRFVRNQGFAIRKELIFHTGKTFNDRSFKVMGTRLDIEMPLHVRFLDIRKNTRAARKGSGFRKSAKGYRIYNRFKEGHKIAIINRMSVEFTDKVVSDIRSQFKLKK